MNDTNAILLLITLLILKHFVCDWLLQDRFPYQFLNKGTYGHPGGLLHAGIATLGTAVALSIYGEVYSHFPAKVVFSVLLAENVFHYHLDWLKMNLNKWLKLDKNRDGGFWDLVGADQTLHHLSYVVMVWVLTQGG